MIGLINYGSGNIHAIANLHKRLNIPYFISDNIQKLREADKLILPGVGDFDETMLLLNKFGLISGLNELVLQKQMPILGVCVGMQILGESSEEGTKPGFGWIKGQVRKLDETKLNAKPYLPHLGWNSILPKQNHHNLFHGVDFESGFYFLHSYYFDCTFEKDILATTQYGINFASAIQHDNVFGMQFHPEKSHKNGEILFMNYANIK